MGTLAAVGDDDDDEEEEEEVAAGAVVVLAFGFAGGANLSGATFASLSGTCDCANCEFAARFACGGR